MAKWNFRILISFILFSFFTFTFAQQSTSKCPRNFDGESFAKLKGKVGKMASKIVAFDGSVRKINPGYNNLPYVLVSFDNDHQIWISSMVSDKSFSIGKKIRILGFICQVTKDDEIGSRYNDGGIQIRAFAILDTQTKAIQMNDAFKKEVEIWKNGAIPKNLKNY